MVVLIVQMLCICFDLTRNQLHVLIWPTGIRHLDSIARHQGGAMRRARPLTRQGRLNLTDGGFLHDFSLISTQPMLFYCFDHRILSPHCKAFGVVLRDSLQQNGKQRNNHAVIAN